IGGKGRRRDQRTSHEGGEQEVLLGVFHRTLEGKRKTLSNICCKPRFSPSPRAVKWLGLAIAGAMGRAK
ncbi:MAG TPA: hypothetical protein VFF94_02055, partial [Novosphingobium sp.]|nr:hypothetical protein [Novosphingobium sp.]